MPLGPPLDYNPFEQSPDDMMAMGPTTGPVQPVPIVDTTAPPVQAGPGFMEHVAEVPAGIAAGAIGTVGTGMKGLATYSGPSDEYRGLLSAVENAPGQSPEQLKVLKEQTFSPSLSPSQRTMLRSAVLAVENGDTERHSRLVDRMKGMLPDPITERGLWKAGEDVTEFGQRAFPASPGMEDSFGRQVGMGLGSLATGVAASALHPAAGAAFFTTLGMGEAADRAAGAYTEQHGPDAVASGAFDEEIGKAAALGVAPGMTDQIPAEILLRRLPVPGARAVGAAVRAFGGERTMKALGSIGVQAAVEATQEGGQQAMQNLIAQEIHSPETRVTEGILPATGVGGTVGGIAGAGREGVLLLAGRRSRSPRGRRAQAVRDVPPPSPEDEASPIPTKDIHEGRERIADAEASEGVSRYLEAQGLPKVGQPVRVVRPSGLAFEGIIEDATDEDGGHVSIAAPDGTFFDAPMAEIQATGSRIEGLPMPPSQEEAEAAAAELTQQEEKELPEGDVEETARTEADTGAWKPPLSATQAQAVTTMVRAGVKPEEAIAAAATMPSGDVDTIGEVTDATGWTPPAGTLAPDGAVADAPAAPPIMEPAVGADAAFPSADVDTLGGVEADTGRWTPPTEPAALPAVPPSSPAEVERAGGEAEVFKAPPPPQPIQETAPVEGEPYVMPEIAALLDEDAPVTGIARPEPTEAAMVDRTVETEAPVEAEVQVRKDGQPFKTEKSAELAANMRNMGDEFAIVPVEGGFGIQPSTAADALAEAPGPEAFDAGVPFGEAGPLGGEPTAAEGRPVDPATQPDPRMGGFPGEAEQRPIPDMAAVPQAESPTEYAPEAFDAGVPFGGEGQLGGEPTAQDSYLQSSTVQEIAPRIAEQTEAASAVAPEGPAPQQRTVAPAASIARAAQAVVPKVGPKQAAIGVKRANKAILSATRGIPNSDWRTMQRAGIVSLPEMAANAREEFKPGKPLATAPMAMFVPPQEFAKAVAYMATYNKAQEAGESAPQARRQAKEAADAVTDAPPRQRASAATRRFTRDQIGRAYKARRSGILDLLSQLYLMASAGQMQEAEVLNTAIGWMRTGGEG